MHLTLRKAAAAASTAYLLFAATSAQASDSLANAVISASYNADSVLALSDNYSGTTQVSGLDPYNLYVEFLTADALFGFDFAADGHLTIFNNNTVSTGSYIASFDFGSSLGAAIKTFTVSDAGLTTGTPVLTVVNDHTISIDLSGVEWNGEFSTLETNIVVQSVPEPETVWMLMAGLLGIGVRARRRSR
ncbi:PEP-CTERM sorting domain-containing protein [Duganella sp. FT80W]|uniref:PEP-CTERM sorting domain-containing protein n=1 Tax=Duganella guangzhouensis TaxID=2666084 RepID=A0A6I2L198_9BURK|nr:PEP-CTERM sorting domain-containing protein [Duganella guangzhouensis]MRW90514.1 PEP-CTERM sorting domain-containing protein [Duganella guangzhouensis]